MSERTLLKLAVKSKITLTLIILLLQIILNLKYSNDIVNTVDYSKYIMGKSKSLKIMYQNLGHGKASRKLTEIECILDEEHPHVLFIGESKCCDKVKDKLLNTHGYITEDTGGRLFALIDRSVRYKRLGHLDTVNSPGLWLEVGTKSKCIIGGYYREWQIIGQPNSKSIGEQRKICNKM